MGMQEKSYRIHIRQGEFEIDVEGDRAFVEAYVEAFLSEESGLEPFQEAAPEERAKTKRLAKQKTPARRNRSAGEPRQEVSADTTALKAYMKGKKVESNKARYLQYMRFWHSRGEKQVGDRHIQACYLAENLPVPPTGRQNFGSLRKDGLVKAGTQRGLWTLTSLALETAPAATKKSRGPKVAGRKKAKPAGRKKEQPAAAGPRKARKRAVYKTVPPAKSSDPKRAAKKKPASRRAPAKTSPKALQEVAQGPEGV
jgi:hypothetical protein